MKKSKYQHDCTKCTYLGNATIDYLEYDFYCCGQPANPTLLWRNGDEPHEYGSADLCGLTITNPQKALAFSLYFRKLNAIAWQGFQVSGKYWTSTDNKPIIINP